MITVTFNDCDKKNKTIKGGWEIKIYVPMMERERERGREGEGERERERASEW